ncbi:pyridoxamine 5'-phosphate oxidase [Neolewinella xylanilytica]|uniref:Pyridoxine/pyridoxamine 5'-phosphate oxidase n=1 Tax=Neolewinella xylanilytica TaxID=1514080 RepID=A0A2S6I7D5_9BACT|nr:pyridoxamine 5'-phosphate oxidase [Neolewinella xylanilytica]PPK87421.1 pyridoxamine 5'-phosphate oxidase [Neolewinella xylanilytica]
MAIDAKDLRVDYQADELLEKDAPDQPFPLFDRWFEEAKDSDDPEPNAMIVATVNAEGHPAARTVLLKEVNESGFVFYTNYDSRKGHEIDAHPHVAVVFNWLELQRSVRIEGRVEKVDEQTSTEYFQSRPKKSQIGAWTSPQSDVIPDRDYLDRRKEDLEKKYQDSEVLPKPDNWGGYVVIPEMIEFWQGRSSRLHDRLVYRREANQNWKRERLAP